MKNHKLVLLTAASGLLPCVAVQATGNLGDRFVEVAAVYVDPGDRLEAAGGQVTFNVPLQANLDAQIFASGVGATRSGMNVRAYATGAGLRYFSDASANGAKPFFGAEAGLIYTKSWGFSDESFAYSVFGGIELPLNDVYVLDLELGWSDAVDYSGSVYGDALLKYRVSENLVLGAGVGYSYDVDTEDGAFTLGVSVRVAL